METKPEKLSLAGVSMPIKALDGSKLIGSANFIFKLFISSDFINSFFSQRSKIPSRSHYLRMYKIEGTEFTLADIFSVYHKTWDERVLTQNQVVEFCTVYGECLKGNFSFFLCKKDEYQMIDINNLSANLFVVLVQGHTVREKSEFAVYTLELDDPHLWMDREYYQFIMPESQFLKGI
ncbi:MAG: hypothetical protein WCK37_03160 [Candidatus Falkowbacteria bacterium]